MRSEEDRAQSRAAPLVENFVCASGEAVSCSKKAIWGALRDGVEGDGFAQVE
jgi:hypothetical protein